MGLGLARKGALLSLFYLTHTKASTPRSILQDDVTWRKQSCKKSCHSALAATSYKKDMQLRDTKEKERNAHTPVFAHDATYTSFMLKLPHHFLRGCTNTHYQENTVTLTCLHSNVQHITGSHQPVLPPSPIINSPQCS